MSAQDSLRSVTGCHATRTYAGTIDRPARRPQRVADDRAWRGVMRTVSPHTRLEPPSALLGAQPLMRLARGSGMSGCHCRPCLTQHESLTRTRGRGGSGPTASDPLLTITPRARDTLAFVSRNAVMLPGHSRSHSQTCAQWSGERRTKADEGPNHLTHSPQELPAQRRVAMRGPPGNRDE
jgi:hypothetical protein